MNAQPMSPVGSKLSRKPTLLRIASVIPMRRTYVTLALMTLAGAAEGIGIASLLPLVATLGPDGANPKGIGGVVRGVVEGFGLEPSLELFLFVLIVGMALKAALTILALDRVGRASADVANKMRIDLIDALMRARWSYFARQPTGRLSAAISTEASQSGDAYNASAKFATEAIQMVIYLAIGLIVSWKLGLLAIGLGLFLVLTLNRFLTVAKRTATIQKRHLRSLVAGLTDVLAGIKPMKAMGRHARFQTLFERDAAIIRKAQRKQSFARDANRALQEPVMAICLAVVLYFAVGVMAMPTGQLVIMALLLVRIVGAIGKAQQALQTVKVAQAGFLAISESIELARSMREPDRFGPAPTLERGVEFREVAFAYGDEETVSNVSFTAERGKLTTLTGSSGAGKTTLLDLLLGLYEPSRGEILVDDAPLSSLGLAEWRRMTGYVPQEQLLFHDTLLMNVTLGEPEYNEDDVWRALQGAGAMPFVEKLPEGLQTVVGERGVRFSGGQRQRIAIARALVHRPRMLVLDEATTALDPETEAAIVANVADLARSEGLTVIAISHQPAWAKASDMVVRLAHGRVASVEARGGAAEHVEPRPALGTGS